MRQLPTAGKTEKNNELVTGLRVLAIRNAEEAVRLMEKGKKAE